jgi:hypothetical protein
MNCHPIARSANPFASSAIRPACGYLFFRGCCRHLAGFCFSSIKTHGVLHVASVSGANRNLSAFPADQADDAFSIRVLPRQPPWGRDYFDNKFSRSPAKFDAIDAIIISHQIAKRFVSSTGLGEFPHRPRRRRMLGDVKVQDSSSIVAQDNQHERKSRKHSTTTDEKNTATVCVSCQRMPEY